jgi:hypothetical protein
MRADKFITQRAAHVRAPMIWHAMARDVDCGAHIVVPGVLLRNAFHRMLQPPILRHFGRVDLRREISGGAAPLIIQSAMTGIGSDPNADRHVDAHIISEQNISEHQGTLK